VAFRGIKVLARSQTLAELFLALKPRKSTTKRALRPDDNPAFQEIWASVGAVPRGQVSTYGAVARAAGLPGRARLVGRALRLAPKTLHLPWHRVVGAGGRIVFPRLSVEHREQTRRLVAEKVIVTNGRVSRTFMTTLESR
jgi:methylated-DNA-protein-cysteine methyltransferase-like protein